MRVTVISFLLLVLATVSTLADQVEDPVAAFRFGLSDVIRPAPISEADNQNYSADEAQAKIAIAILARAVREERRVWISRQIAYPLIYRVNGRDALVRGPAEFLRHYDQIVTPLARQVLSVPGDSFFTNWRGTIIGRGDISAFVVMEPVWRERAGHRRRCVTYPQDHFRFMFQFADTTEIRELSLAPEQKQPISSDVKRHNDHIATIYDRVMDSRVDPLGKYHCPDVWTTPP